MNEATLNVSLPSLRLRAADRSASLSGMLRVLLASMLVLGALALAGCSGDDNIPYEERPVEDIYNKAMDLFLEGIYVRSAKEFDEVERQHPYSIWAKRAILMSAYAYYRANRYDEAILAAQRFISLHPGSEEAPYAHYLVALCSYEQISDVGRDQKMTEDALAALSNLIKKFPQTEYARDARLKLDLTRDHLAGKEMEVGRYYLKRGEYVAAINRFRTVIEKYQTTTHIPESLLRLTEAYLSLGIKQEAQTAAAILGHNYPGSEWYEDAYALLAGENLEPHENRDSWISRAWHAFF